MWDVDVDVGDAALAGLEDRLRRGHEHPGRELEHLATVHRQELLLALGEEAGAAPREVELPAAGAVGAELEAEEAALVDPLEHDRPGSIPEQDQRRAVGPVEHAREDVAAD